MSTSPQRPDMVYTQFFTKPSICMFSLELKLGDIFLAKGNVCRRPLEGDTRLPQRIGNIHEVDYCAENARFEKHLPNQKLNRSSWSTPGQESVLEPLQ